MTTAGAVSSVAVDALGEPWVAFDAHSKCGSTLWVARPTGPAVFYRGTTVAFDPSWQSKMLPLWASTDDETAPFPSDATIPGATFDTSAFSGVLIAYRVLWKDQRPAGNSLRVVGGPSGLMISY